MKLLEGICQILGDSDFAIFSDQDFRRSRETKLLLACVCWGISDRLLSPPTINEESTKGKTVKLNRKM